MGTSAGYNGHPFEEILLKLLDLNDVLRPHTQKTQVYQIPSQTAAKQTQLAIAKWAGNAGSSAPPNFQASEFRAAIYDIGRPSAQLVAYRSVFAVVVLEHATLAQQSLELGRLTLGMSALRGIIERTGFLADNLRRLKSLSSGSDPSFENVLHATEIIGRTIYGTRLNWEELSRNDLRSIKPADLEYVQKKDSADMKSKSTLSGVDVLDKLVPGSRAAYEILCEFLHPNVGDVVSATLRSRAFDDAKGTRHIQRELGVGGGNLAGQADFHRIVQAALSVTGDILRLVPQLLAELDDLAGHVAKMTRQSQHEVIGKYRDLFSRGDPCPCLSGKTIRHCAPAALKGKTNRR